jgi:hypothetical protein
MKIIFSCNLWLDIFQFFIKAEGGAGKDKKKGREPKNQVHQEAILVETIRKELAQQKLFTNYSVNPFKKCKSDNLYWF